MNEQLDITDSSIGSLMFEATMRHHAARLSDMAARWTRGMTTADRDFFLESALAIAFRRRAQFDPAKHAIGVWFMQCLGTAARRKREWRVFRAGEWTDVPAKHLEVKL